MQYFTIKDVEGYLRDGVKIAHVSQENDYIMIELSNNIRIKIKNF